MKNTYVITGITTLAIGAVTGFFGGMQYQLKQQPAISNQMITRTGGPAGQLGTRTMQGNRGGTAGMTPVGGEIIGQDNTSITVKLPDGSTKIVLLSDQTAINKSLSGEKTDLKTGEQVTAFGTQNPDGSVTAQSVSIGGSMMFRGLGAQPQSSAMPATP